MLARESAKCGVRLVGSESMIKPIHFVVHGVWL